MIKDMLSIYSMAELLPLSETIELRTTGTRAFAEWLDSQEIEVQATSVEIAFHRPDNSDLATPAIQQLMEHLAKVDSEFPNEPAEVSMCLRACVIAALGELVQTPSSSATDIAALCVAGYSRFALSKESRLISTHVKNLYRSAVISLEKAGLSLRGASFTKEPSKPLTLINLAEEVDVLWWVENSFSVSTKSSYADLEECEIPFWLAHDLASIVRAPATQGIRNLLSKESKRLTQSTYTWKEVSAAVLRTLSSSDCSPLDLPDIVPSRVRLFPTLASTIGRIEDKNCRLNFDLEQTGSEWAAQVFNEILATKILERETTA